MSSATRTMTVIDRPSWCEPCRRVLTMKPWLRISPNRISLGSAAGRAYLAFCGGAERDALLESLSRSLLPEDRLARSRTEVERLLNETRAQGFGMAQRPRRVSEEISLAIPVRVKDRVLATVTVRYAATAVPLRTAVEQFLPKMREVAHKIETEFV